MNDHHDFKIHHFATFHFQELAAQEKRQLQTHPPQPTMFQRSHLIARVVCALAIGRMSSVAGYTCDKLITCLDDYMIDAYMYYNIETVLQAKAPLNTALRFPLARTSNSSAAATAASETSEMGGDESELPAGYVRVVGFREGTTPDGAANSTIAVAYDIEGLDAGVEFRVEMEDGPPSFCEDLQPGQVDADYPDLQSPEVAEGAWHQVAATSDAGGGSEGVAYIDVGFGVEELLDHPVVLYDSGDAVLACGILAQLVAEEDSAENENDVTGTSSGSLPRSGTYSLARFILVCCLFVSYFCL